MPTMKAAVHDRYGADHVTIREVERPVITEDGVLVRVRASSINAADWYAISGRPYVARPMIGLRRPKSPFLGGDFAGIVEGVGASVTGFRTGDEVFGHRRGGFAEYVVAEAVEHKPANLTLEEAAAVPIAGLTALQGLRDHGGLRPGQKLLVNGASGGVGTFAVQIAKALGAEVTAVCSTGNVELAASLGADHVIDYTREDFTRTGERYDLLFDNAGTRSWLACRRAVSPGGIVVLVGGPREKRLLGPLGHVAATLVATKIARRRATFFVAKPNPADLGVLRELIESGRVKPVVERRYELADVAEAVRCIGAGHARGKLVVAV